MKGPGLRVDNDVRRVWVCPACGARSRADGDLTSLRCGCRPDGVFMRLEESRRQTRRFEIPPADVAATDPSLSHPEPGGDPSVVKDALVEREVEREIAVVAEAHPSSENDSTPETEAKNSPEALPSGGDASERKTE